MSDKQIDQLVKSAKAEYQRQWRKKNPDKAKKHSRDYWARRALREKSNETKTEG